MEIETKIRKVFADLLAARNVRVSPDFFRPELVLLESGLDSLGFAALVVQLEQVLGYDPFVLMEEPFYPTTYKDFVSVYEKFKEHCRA